MQADEQYGIVARYPEQFRALPIAAGAGGFTALLLNRFLSGAAPVIDAESSQSRVDVLVIAMAATLALTGFQWLTLKPVEPKQAPLLAFNQCICAEETGSEHASMV